MSGQELWSLLNLYKSVFSGEQIDEAIGAILNGKVDAAVGAAENSAAAAAASATAAAGSATASATAETNAARAATRADENATEAQTWANKSKEYAELAKTRVAMLTLRAEDWVESDERVFDKPVFTQTVTFAVTTTNATMVILPRPSNAIMDALQKDGVVMLRIDNDNGVDTFDGNFTAKAVGAAPSADFTMQTILLEG